MFMLTIITETYSRTESGKSWRSKPDEVETETLPWHHRDARAAHRYVHVAQDGAWFGACTCGWEGPDQDDEDRTGYDFSDHIADLPHGERMHRNSTEAATLRWFRRLGGSEYAERSHTPVGYIVTRLISTNPDRSVRKVRKFRITDEPTTA